MLRMFMLQQHADNKQDSHIVTAFEISLLFVAFLSVLFFLYPKEGLEKKILSENSNYTLTTIYLKNLISLNSEDSNLVFAMAKSLHQQGKLELSSNLLELLESNPDDDVKAKATLLHLTLNNSKLQKPITKNEKERIIKKNHKLLSSISNETITDRKSNETLYHTAISLNERTLALRFNLNIIKNKTTEKYLFWLKNAHYLAEEVGDKNTNIQILKTLVIEDTSKSRFWLDALLPQLDKDTNLAHLASELKLKDEALAELYILNNQSLKASKIYISILNKTTNKNEKKALLIKVISILQGNNQISEAASFASRYENDYIMDKEMTKKFLKLYFAANRADMAKQLSLKIIKKRRQK